MKCHRGGILTLGMDPSIVGPGTMSGLRMLLLAIFVVCGSWTAAAAATLESVAGINERGQVLGFCPSSGSTNYCLWEHGTTTDLGIASSAPYFFPLGLINNRGQILGNRLCEGTSSPQAKSFLWHEGDVIELDEDCQVQSAPIAINAHQVLWNVGIPPGPGHPILWDNGVRRDIEVEDGLGSFATAMNDHGQIVGWIDHGEAGAQAFLWENGITTMLGGVESYAVAINNRGQILVNTDNFERSFLWENGETTDLGPCWGMSLNEQGQVVGSMLTDTGVGHAFLWDRGVKTDLGTLPGDRASLAFLINDQGDVLGRSDRSAAHRHAFIWRAGVMTDLGTLGGDITLPDDMNNRGQVVGHSGTATGEVHVFLWERGIITDLSISIVP